MSEQREAPPAGVETVPDDVNEELNRIEKEANHKLIQKIMDDPEFGKRLQENAEEVLSDESLLDELGAGSEVEGHYRWTTKWRYSYYYGWIHWHRRAGVWHIH